MKTTHPVRMRSGTWTAVALLGLGLAAHASETPQALAGRLAAVMKTGDLAATMALYDLHGTPADLQAMAIDTLQSCYDQYDCKVAAVPLNDEFRRDMEKVQANPNWEFQAQPDGLIAIEGFVRGKSGQRPEAKWTMPYAIVDGRCRIVSEIRTAQANARLRAKSARAIAEDELARGVGYPADRRWKSKSTRLPRDGGEPGKALAALVSRRAAAYQHEDFAALIALGGLRAKVLYADRHASGAPIPLKVRRLVLHGQYLQDFQQVTVLGGFVRDDTAAVIVDGLNGAGWLVRGVVLMQKRNGSWIEREHRTITIPAI